MKYTIENLEYRIVDKAIDFNGAMSLCVDGWRMPTIDELKLLVEKYYKKGNKRFLHGHHKRPKMYWLKGIPKNPFKGGEDNYKEEGEIAGLFNIDLNCCFFMSLHENPQHLILVKNK